MRAGMMLLPASVALLFFPAWGCSHTRADEMSVDQHRAQAQLAEEDAARERSEYDPHAAVVEPYPAAMHLTTDAPAGILRTYNPTEGHLEAAHRHEREASEHLAAARDLEQFEDAACAGISRAVRASCPFVTPDVNTVDEVADGIRMHLRPGASGRALASLMKCHLAFARSRGFPIDARCPLYIRGVSVGLTNGGTIIEVRGADAPTAAEVRRQAVLLFAPRPLEP